MKVKFLRDCQIRDPKTYAVISDFKKDQVCDLTEAGAAHFIAAGDAEAVPQQPAPTVLAAPAPEIEVEKPAETRRHRG